MAIKSTELDVIVENLRKKGYSYSDIFKLMKKETLDSVPIKVLKNRNLGMLESSVIFLKDEKNLKYSEIAKLLNRNPRTIWTAYNKGKKKLI